MCWFLHCFFVAEHAQATVGWGILVEGPRLIGKPAEDLALAARWLEDNFGVTSCEDLEGADIWAKDGLTVVNADRRLSAWSKATLQEVLRKLCDSDSRTVAIDSSKQTLTSQEDLAASPPQREAPSANPQEEELVSPNPDDALAEALAKLFPSHSPTARDAAASWMDSRFGVQVYEDLEGAEVWRDSAQSLIDVDTDLTAEAKEVLTSVLSRRPGMSAQGSKSGIGSETMRMMRSSSSSSKAGSGLKRRKDFTTLRQLGSGSFASVQLVEDRSSKESFALKEIGPTALADAAIRAQILQEVSIHESLEHEAILRCHAHFEEAGSMYLLLELAGGGDLFHYLERENSLNEPEAARLFAEVAAGIHYLHVMKVMHPERQVTRCLHDCACDSLMRGKEWQRSCGPKAPCSPEALRCLLAMEMQGIAILAAIASRKKRPHCSLVGDGDICDL